MTDRHGDAPERHEPVRTQRDDELTGTPRWVKLFGAIALVVMLLFVVLLLTGRGGEHGPGRHGAAVTGPATNTERQ